MSEKISIVIVSYNLKEDTAACIDSLYAAGASLDQIIIVDNASTDGSISYLREKIGPLLKLIISGENKGYASGVNLGVQAALAEGTDWVLIMNNDTHVASDFIQQMTWAIEIAGNTYALFGPLILFHDFPQKVWYFGDKRVPGTLFTYNPYYMKPFPADTPVVMPVDFLNGCAMLIHRSVFERIGLFDDSIFMYSEEVDFCWRARQAGFKMAGIASARMWHKVSASAKRVPEKSLIQRTRNQILFYRRYASWAQMPVMFLLSSLRNLGFMLKYLVNGLPGLSLAVMQGWKDGWFVWKP